jgi:hypothetical protein
MRGANKYKVVQEGITAQSAAAVADMAGAQQAEDMSYEVAGEGAEAHVLLGLGVSPQRVNHRAGWLPWVLLLHENASCAPQQHVP